MARTIMTTESAAGAEAAAGRIEIREVDKVFTPSRGTGAAIEALRSISITSALGSSCRWSDPAAAASRPC